MTGIGHKPVVLISSAWPPTVGGASTFAVRLTSDPRLKDHFDFCRHQSIKRPTMFLTEDLPHINSAAAPLRKTMSAIRNFFGFWGLMHKTRPGIVQVHYNGPCRGPLLVEVSLYIGLARAYGARTIVRHASGHHMHLVPPKSFWGYYARNFYVRWLDVLMLQDEQLVPAHLGWLGDAASSLRIIAVPNTVDTRKYRPAGTPPAGDYFRVGCVAGPETERKGCFVLIEAVRRIVDRAQIPNIRIDAIAATDEFVDAVDRAGLGDYFEIRDVLAEPAKLDWFHSLSAFALPAFLEGFPNVLVEAMACGVPSVASSVGAVASIISDGHDGLIIEAGDVDGLLLALVRLANDPDETRQMGRRARETTTLRYAVDGPWIEPIARLYDCLAGRSSA